jgi:hypothetical protein
MELLKPLSDSSFAAQTVAFTGTAGSTTGWPAGPQGVVIWTTSPAYVRVGEGVTATTSDTPIPSNTPIPFAVPNGTGAIWRVSAIQISSGGSVYAKPINIQ